MIFIPRRRYRLAAAVLTLTGSLAVAQASQAQTDPKGAQRGSAPAAVPVPPWQAAANAAADLGATLPNAFAGAVVNPKDQVADIYVVRGSGPLGDQISKAAGKYARVHVVDRSYTALIGTRDRNAVDSEWLTSIGLKPTVLGPTTPKNGVFINVRSFTPEQDKAVRDRYGSFVELRQSSEEITQLAGRWADSQPWYGGDTITRTRPYGSDVTPTCTLGPILRNIYSGNVYAVTAAHCGAKYTNWYNNVPNTYNPQRFVGQAVDVNAANNGTDSAIIYSNAYPYQWASGNVANPQRGTAVTRDMDSGLCVTGSLSGEWCGSTVVAGSGEGTNLCYFGTINQAWVGGIFVMQRDGTPVAGSGDSGAAVYSYTSNGILVRGMLSGADTSAQHTAACQYWWNIPRRVCSDKVYVMPIQRIEQNWWPSVTMTT